VRGTALAAGKTYRARIKLSTTHNRTYVALRAPVPSGAEILDAAFSSTPKGADEKPEAETDDGYYWKPHSQVSYQAIYDNEIHYFYDYIDAGETELNFLFRTARRGVYPTPPITAECMYEPEIFGRSSGLLWTIE
jgi:uncharacterized protein YfaS (alpha-2-macroglobulin family)